MIDIEATPPDFPINSSKAHPRLGTMTLKFSLLPALLLLVNSALGVDETQRQYLSGQGKDDTVTWAFLCTAGRLSGVWTNIPVPSCWELQGFGTYGYATDPDAEQGKYRTTFTVPADWSGRVVRLVFEGAMTDTEAWLNGQSVGSRHCGGFYRFAYDVSTQLRYGGSNLLEVTVSKTSTNASVNSAERRGDYWNFGGIFRPVYLEAVPTNHIERTAIDARVDGRFSMDVHLAGEADRVVARIEGLGTDFSAPVPPGAATVRLQTAIRGQRNWTAETPDLYRVTVMLEKEGRIMHRVNERFGFRTIEVRPGDGLYVNGTRVLLKGCNRHSFWPDSGRTLSETISRADVNLMKDMNMNAVRMSHYPPDQHFLEACDELGLYVLDELGGWQHAYDTAVGTQLVRAMVTRDVNHPSVLFWCNGNEGGFNFDLDGEYAKWDPQGRRVLHPWSAFSDINTAHYRPYNEVVKSCASNMIYMPTEFMHGLYDGGAGAGLDDYWNVITRSTVGAGGFIWALVDEGVVRTDQAGKIDTIGNRGPDGIVGPYREKEGSFFTIRDVWCPVQIGLRALPAGFNGRLPVENRYDFTALNRVRFAWELLRFPGPLDTTGRTVLARGTQPGPPLPPGAKGELVLKLPADWHDADALRLVATDAGGREIGVWTWPLKTADDWFARVKESKTGKVDLQDKETGVRVEVNDTVLIFSRQDGCLTGVAKAGRTWTWSPNPSLVLGGTKTVEVKEDGKTLNRTQAVDLAGISKLQTFNVKRDGAAVVIESTFAGPLKKLVWTIDAGGWIRLDYAYQAEGEFTIAGIDFAYPQDRVKALRYLGQGPYRVWQNRMRGPTLDVWSLLAANGVPGKSWSYPEFQGYRSGWRWAVLETLDGPLSVINGTNAGYLGIYRPLDGADPVNTTLHVPETGLALLDVIPAIGTKFNPAEELGPQSQKARLSGTQTGKVYLRF